MNCLTQKKVLAIHDISCVGRCSLTVALPILSCAGLETSVLPTAVLSTHAGFENFTYRDLTCDITPISNHWKTLDINFNAIYSGFLGSVHQIDLVRNIYLQHKKENTLIMVDPVMADNGKLYKVFDSEMVTGMKKLCQTADIIVPNLTEACFILDKPYNAENYTQEYINNILHELSNLGPKMVVLTGVSFDNNTLGAAIYDKQTDSYSYVYNKKIDGYFHGTGDIFSSTLLSALLNDFTLKDSAQLAVDYTVQCIEKTKSCNIQSEYGVAFELAIPNLVQMLQK